MLKNTVKEWRQEWKVSRAHLARQIGVCRSYVSKLEHGKLQPSGEVMFRLAEYFELRIEDIFERVGEGGSRRYFFRPNMLPNGNGLATPPARPAGMESATDKSLVGPTAKGVASLSRNKPNGKT